MVRPPCSNARMCVKEVHQSGEVKSTARRVYINETVFASDKNADVGFDGTSTDPVPGVVNLSLS